MNQLVPSNDILTIAKEILTEEDANLVTSYLQKGGHPLAPDTAAKFFELFLNGSDCKEIHRLNRPFPYEAILIARIKYNWDLQREEYAAKLQNSIKEKVMRAQLETTDLMTDLLVAAKKKHGDKIKRYLQNGDDKELEGVFNIESIHGLLKVVEGLQKITGQANTHTLKTQNTQTQNLNVNVNAKVGEKDAALSADDAAKILSIIAESKRKKT